MKAMQLSAAGLENLKLVDLPEPEPGPGQVRLRMKAASVNPRDLGVALGRYPARLPIVPLSDGVGVIDAVGPGVTRLRPGDRVSPIFAPRWLSGPPTDLTTSPALGGDLDGVLREAIVADETAVVPSPKHLTDPEAASLTVAGVTAWSALVDYGRVKPGDTVLVEGTGGVALFALQFAKLAGARVAVISSSDEKLERVRALGADVTVNRVATPEWGPAVAKSTGGVDIVVETVGAGTLAQALAACRRGARVAQVGLLGGVQASLPLQLLIPRNVEIRGILVGGRDRYDAMNRAISLHGLRPVIGEVNPFDRAADAIAKIGSGAHFGKIAISF